MTWIPEPCADLYTPEQIAKGKDMTLLELLRRNPWAGEHPTEAWEGK